MTTYQIGEKVGVVLFYTPGWPVPAVVRFHEFSVGGAEAVYLRYSGEKPPTMKQRMYNAHSGRNMPANKDARSAVYIARDELIERGLICG